MVVLIILYYLLALLLTYYCVLANMTVQADNITLQLAKTQEKKFKCLKEFKNVYAFFYDE